MIENIDSRNLIGCSCSDSVSKSFWLRTKFNNKILNLSIYGRSFVRAGHVFCILYLIFNQISVELILSKNKSTKNKLVTWSETKTQFWFKMNDFFPALQRKLNHRILNRIGIKKRSKKAKHRVANSYFFVRSLRIGNHRYMREWVYDYVHMYVWMYVSMCVCINCKMIDNFILDDVLRMM